MKNNTKLNNIEVKYITEEYTSVVSAIDKEEINKANYNTRNKKKLKFFLIS